jgi:hypothetical protein
MLVVAANFGLYEVPVYAARGTEGLESRLNFLSLVNSISCPHPSRQAKGRHTTIPAWLGPLGPAEDKTSTASNNTAIMRAVQRSGIAADSARRMLGAKREILMMPGQSVQHQQ